MSLAPVYELLERNAQDRPGDAFFLHGEAAVTYGDASLTVKRTAAVLRGHGLLPGDRILLQLGNSPEFIYLYLAALQLGVIPILVNPAARRYELRYYCATARPRLVVTSGSLFSQYTIDGQAFIAPDRLLASDDPSGTGLWAGAAASPPLQAFEPPAPDTPAALIFTSATDGFARGALLTHGGIHTAVCAAHSMLVDSRDRFLAMLPFFHSFGLTSSLILPLYSCVPIVLLDRFSPRALLDIFSREPVTITCGVPAMYQILARVLPGDVRFPRMKAWISGGEALSASLQASILQDHGIEIRQGYGLTEASPIVTWNDMASPNRPGSAGRPMPYNEVRILEKGNSRPGSPEGEILVRGANVIHEYFEDKAATRAAIQDGWLRTGDLGYLDTNNYLYVTGRIKEMVIRRGLNVYPREVERILYNHPEIENVRVSGQTIPLEDHSFKESLGCSVHPRQGSWLNANSLAEWCRENISAYKIPETFEFI